MIQKLLFENCIITIIKSYNYDFNNNSNYYYLYELMSKLKISFDLLYKSVHL